MTFAEIREMPTTHRDSNGGIHESVLRSWTILEKVKELLRRNTPADVILEIVEDLQGAPQRERKQGD